MEVTEVRVSPTNGKAGRVKAYCSVAFDQEFVVHDVRVVDGSERPLVAMPSRRRTDRCVACGRKNHVLANYCNHCGACLEASLAIGQAGAARVHVDVAHPLGRVFRDHMNQVVLDACEANGVVVIGGGS